MKMDHNLFRSVPHFERYKNFFLRAGIIQERYVDLEDLRDTFILDAFQVILERLDGLKEIQTE